MVLERRAWRGVWCLVASLVLACSGGEQGKGSGVAMDMAGSGGAAGAAGSLSLGLPTAGGGSGGASMGAAGSGAAATGGVPSVELHTCPAVPDPPCPAKSLAESVSVTAPEQMAALQGVTHIAGDLEIETTQGFDALSCLETVDGEIVIDLFGESGELSLWGLRNLKTVGEVIDISGGTRMYADCGFSRLESAGADYFTGGAFDISGRVAGELDLSKVKVMKSIRIGGSELTRVTLPSNAMLTMGQLSFEGNSKLSEALGFTGITFKSDGIVVGGAYSVLIRNNPMLSECRARELAQIYLDAGASPTTVTVMDNLACP